MLKKYFVIFGIITALLMTNIWAKNDYLDVTAEKSESGQTIDVAVKTNTPLKGFQFKIVGGNDVLHLEKSEKGTAFDTAFVSKFEETDGVVYALAAYSTAADPTDICTLSYTLGDIYETVTVSLTDIKVVTEKESLNVPDITVKIEGETKSEPDGKTDDETSESTGESTGSSNSGSSSSGKKPNSALSSAVNKYVEEKKNEDAKQDETKQENTKEDTKKTTFSDIENHWGKDDIMFLYSKGIVNGISETLFSPDTDVTRAEFCALISRTLGLETVAENIYSDVGKGAWYEKSVLECTAAGFVKGDGGLFRPDDKINRQETAVILSRVCDFLGMEKKTEDICTAYNDGTQIADWAREAVNNVGGYAVMRGHDDNCFAPEESTTRAQAATVIRKIYNFKNTSEGK